MTSDDESKKDVRERNIDGQIVEDAKFVSNVTNIGWKKESHKRWNNVINQVGTVINDEIHQGKNHTTMVLKAGSKVIVDDIRGRIHPQYRVRDSSGKIWFVAAKNLNFDFDEELSKENKENVNISSNYIYRGGVRIDSSDEAAEMLPKRYEMPPTTEEEIKLIKEKKKDG